MNTCGALYYIDLTALYNTYRQQHSRHRKARKRELQNTHS